MVETFAHSLWSAISPGGPAAPPLKEAATADVVVVGGGFFGLSTALHLAEGGAKTILLEAEEPGFGASGRNTGFVVPAFRTGLGPAELAAAAGPERAERLQRLVERSGDVLFDVIQRHAIDCSAENVGWLQPAHTPAFLARLAVRVEQMSARKRPVSLLSAEETDRRTGVRGYAGALFDASGGQVNPLALARGLAKAALSAGARIHGKSRVNQITRDGSGWRVRTATGEVRADRVFLATNALAGSVAEGYGRGFIPVLVHQIATSRLRPDQLATTLAGRSPLSDTRRHTFAVRLSPDGRLVTGGVVIGGPGALARATRTFSRRLTRFLPQAAPFTVDYVWNGVIAVTSNSLPHLTEIAPGLDAAIGCNGRGVALTTALGREIGGLLSGRTAARDFVLPANPTPAIPFQRVASFGPALWLPWSNFRDWLDVRGLS